MNLVNRFLTSFGVRLVRAARPPSLARTRDYEAQYQQLRSAGPRGYRVTREPAFDTGTHPFSFVDFECEFASAALARNGPREVLDIGSYRMFVRGLTAALTVTSIDVRPRTPISSNERVLTCDAKSLPLPDESMDAVVSLCALEHFGLGRYGDELDLDGDLKALAEMKRVLRPGGSLILSTTVTAGPGVVAFNAHRIYPLQDLTRMFTGLRQESEQFYSRAREAPCSRDAVRCAEGVWDVYCGCWRK